jgi:7-carboxy-7-deazaguanine synthase
MNLPLTQPQLELDPPDRDRLRIAETFTSIQGEGRLTGTPSHFIRVSGCNLRCSWCDTAYASWNPEGGTQTVTELARVATESGVRHVVITGGEPMMFPAVTLLARLLRQAHMHITIETAGTVRRDVACDLMSISPKLANSTPQAGDPRDANGAWRHRHESRRLNTIELQALLDAYPERQLKFVVARAADVREIDVLLAKLRGWQSRDVMLMPEGIAPPCPETSRWISEVCALRGWRYCRRLHLDLFGNTRGT